MAESYTSKRLTLSSRLRQSKILFRVHAAEYRARIDALVRCAEECRAALRDEFSFELRDRRILDVGPGQFLVQSRYFALQNRVVSLDSEVVLERLSWRGLLEAARYNGVQRVIKTLARRIGGIDRAYAAALREKLEVGVLPAVELRRGDACQMPFADGSFDMIYSRAVLHHLKDPAAALAEMRRVLRPGGAAWVDLHLYSSWNGSLDPRAMHGRDPRFYWAHLRGDGSGTVEGAHLNKLRLADWREVFSRSWPGVRLQSIAAKHPVLEALAGDLISECRVSGYSREELLTTTIVGLWQKPA